MTSNGEKNEIKNKKNKCHEKQVYNNSSSITSSWKRIKNIARYHRERTSTTTEGEKRGGRRGRQEKMDNLAEKEGKEAPISIFLSMAWMPKRQGRDKKKQCDLLISDDIF